MSAVEERDASETEFEGKAVVGSGVEIPNVAGGLRDAMAFGWVHLEHGDEWCLVLRGKVKKIRHDPNDKEDYTGDLVRVHVLDCEEGTFIDQATVADALKRQRVIIEEGKRRREEESGITRLDFGAPSDDEAFDLATAHASGDHTSPVDGCPICRGGVDDPEEEDEAVVLTRQHLQGVHADGLRDSCPVCRSESEAIAREAQEDSTE